MEDGDDGEDIACIPKKLITLHNIIEDRHNSRDTHNPSPLLLLLLWYAVCTTKSILRLPFLIVPSLHALLHVPAIT